MVAEKKQDNSHLDVIMIYIPKEYEILTSYEDEVTRFDLHDYVKAFAVQKHISTQFITLSLKRRKGMYKDEIKYDM